MFGLPWYHGGFKSKHLCDRGAALGGLVDAQWLRSGPGEQEVAGLTTIVLILAHPPRPRGSLTGAH